MPAPSMGITGFQPPCPGPATSGFWFDVSPSAQGVGKEGREEGPQSPFKADNLCFTKRSDSVGEKTNMSNNGEKKKDITMSPEVQ